MSKNENLFLYMICPVRNASEQYVRLCKQFVADFEEAGHKVHYPPRDVDQSLKDYEICRQHSHAMTLCDAVIVVWDDNSKGCHFDFGMAYMLEKPLFVLMGHESEDKSFGNVLSNFAQCELAPTGPDSAQEIMDNLVIREPECSQFTHEQYNDYTDLLPQVAKSDVKALFEAKKHYGDSWKKRGGVGAFMMLARKWDRLENLMQKKEPHYDILKHLENDGREEGVLDDIRDLRRYLMLVEASYLHDKGTTYHGSDIMEDNITLTINCDRARDDNGKWTTKDLDKLDQDVVIDGVTLGPGTYCLTDGKINKIEEGDATSEYVDQDR